MVYYELAGRQKGVTVSFDIERCGGRNGVVAYDGTKAA
jgi:hypothetical protein